MSEFEANKNNTEIEISNSEGDSLKFSLKSFSRENKKKYKEVNFSNKSLVSNSMSTIGLQIANNKLTTSAILKQAPNGLYTATTNVSNLSKFADGTTSTIVRKNGKISGHAGFEQLNISNILNPAMIVSIGLQAMSIISGTHYLNEISQELSNIQASLSELVEMHHDEKIGKLLSIRSSLSDYSSRSILDDSDVLTIRSFKKDADSIEKEYLYRLERYENFDLDLKNDKKIEELITQYNQTAQITSEACITSLMCELSEIMIRMKQGNNQEIVEDLIKQFEAHYEKSFFSTYPDKIDFMYVEHINTLIKKNKLEFDNESNNHTGENIVGTLGEKFLGDNGKNIGRRLGRAIDSGVNGINVTMEQVESIGKSVLPIKKGRSEEDKHSSTSTFKVKSDNFSKKDLKLKQNKYFSKKFPEINDYSEVLTHKYKRKYDILNFHRYQFKQYVQTTNRNSNFTNLLNCIKQIPYEDKEILLLSDGEVQKMFIEVE